MPKNKWVAGMVLGGMTVFLLVSAGYAEDGIATAPTGPVESESAITPPDATSPALPQDMIIANRVINTPPFAVTTPPPMPVPPPVEPPPPVEGAAPAVVPLGVPPAPEPPNAIDPECENPDEDPGYDPEDGLPVLFEPDLVPVPDPAFTDPKDLPVIEIADTATMYEEYPELDPKNGLI